MNEKEDCSQLAPYLLSTGSFTFTFLLLCLPRGSERKHHCLISDPRTLSQLLPHHHKGGASPGITLHILPHCTEGSPQSASHWACLCLTQNIWSHLRYNVLNILMSYLQLRLKLKKKGERDTFMSAFQFAELWINWASIMRLFFLWRWNKPESNLSSVGFGVAPQLFGLQMVLFKWILGEPYQGSPNPLQPPTKFLRGCWWGWHTVWANSVCPQKQGVFDVHK